MKRVVTVASIVLLGLAGMAGIAWYSGLVDRLLVDRFVHQPQRENLARQLATPAGYAGRREPDFSRFEARISQVGETRTRELDALLEGASILEIQRFFERGRLKPRPLTVHGSGASPKSCGVCATMRGRSSRRSKASGYWVPELL